MQSKRSCSRHKRTTKRSDVSCELLQGQGAVKPKEHSTDLSSVAPAPVRYCPRLRLAERTHAKKAPIQNRGPGRLLGSQGRCAACCGISHRKAGQGRAGVRTSRASAALSTVARALTDSGQAA